MKDTRPYQPFLLRVLHGLTGMVTIAAILTAYWTFDTYDGRWLGSFLPKFPEIESIHGTFGLYTLLIFPLFALYAFRKGYQRLIQKDSIAQLAQIGKQSGWYSLHRLINTIALFALTFAIYSGRMMDSDWLPRGEIEHRWYYAHLLAWLLLLICILGHVLISAKVGGLPLLLSICRWRSREQDHPRLWPQQIAHWCSKVRPSDAIAWLQSPTRYKILEILVLTAILGAWIVPLFSK
jgi:Prokaryotic cytochrome b561